MSNDGGEINAIGSELIRTLIDETVARAVSSVRVPRLVPGTVTDGSGTNPDQLVNVLIDGDTDPITVTSLIGAVTDAQRVMVMFYPPAGAVIIGVIGGDTYLRIMNSDRTAPVFEVTNGRGGFPLSTATWQPNYETTNQNTRGYRLSGDAVFVTGMWTCIMSLVTDQIAWEFDILPDASWATGQLAIGARALDSRSSGANVLTTVAPSLDNSSPQNIQGVMTVPPGIIVGSSDVVGSIVEFIVYARRTSGSGNVAVAPLHPIWCV